MIRRLTDQLGRTVEVPLKPQRIISVVPSQTELLFALGLDEEVIGITKFCVHPEEQFRKKERIGGTKRLNLDRIRALKPDFILANKEENDAEQILALAEEFPVWVSDILTLEDSTEMIRQISKIMGVPLKGEQMSLEISKGFNLFTPPRSYKTAYFIWHEPMMVAASQTFIDHILNIAGFDNVFAHLERYPKISEQDLRLYQPEVVLLSSEPFPFRDKHISYFKELCPRARVQLVDGELFSWYGNRLLLTPPYLKTLHDTLRINSTV